MEVEANVQGVIIALGIKTTETVKQLTEGDAVAVYETVKKAAEICRKGEGPVLVEAKTYRWAGHSKSDKNLYRTQEEIDSWK